MKSLISLLLIVAIAVCGFYFYNKHINSPGYAFNKVAEATQKGNIVFFKEKVNVVALSDNQYKQILDENRKIADKYIDKVPDTSVRERVGLLMDMIANGVDKIADKTIVPDINKSVISCVDKSEKCPSFMRVFTDTSWTYLSEDVKQSNAVITINKGDSTAKVLMDHVDNKWIIVGLHYSLN